MGLFKHFVRGVSFPLALARAGDLAQLRYLAEYEDSQFHSAEQLRETQLARLRTLLEYAYRESPFYQERFDRLGLRPADIRSLEDLHRLPVLEKREIQENRDAMVARHWPRSALIANQTGGSTGSPISFYLSRDRKCSRAAATVRHNRWAGWDIGDKVAYIWGAPRDVPANGWRAQLRNMLLERQLFLDTGHLTEEKMAAYCGRLQRFQPKVIVAYARSATAFARYLQSRNGSPIRPHSIVTSAEVLEDEDRLLLEKVFGCPVFNRYGCREVSVIASECEHHQGLHIMAEGLLVEVVQGERPAPAGQMGAILVTDLLNLAMPLIRYRIGDTGIMEEGSCSCGRSLPRLRQVAGRVTDLVVGGDGRLVSGVFLATYVIAQRPSLGQVQIRQSEAGKVLYRIKPGRAFDVTADLDYLTSATRRYLGETTSVAWELVEELPTEASGKFLFCRSTVTPDFMKSPRAELETVSS